MKKYLWVLCVIFLVSCATPQQSAQPEIPVGTPSEQLIKKAAKGTYAEGQALIAKGADINYVDYKGISVLHVATHFKNRDFIRLLLDNKVKINVFSYEGITPLAEAIHSGDADLVKLLIDHGADVNEVQDPRLGPLNTALYMDSIEMLEILVNAGVDINQGYANNGVFSCALSIAKTEKTLEFLLKHGANPNIYIDIEQDMPYLFMLLHSKSHAMLSVALQNGADPNKVGKLSKTSPLHVAVAYKDIEAVKLLLQYGADKDNFDLQLKKPIDLAKELELNEIVELLN